MPIRPENKARYPKDWKQIRARILERAHDCCEFCGVRNHSVHFNERTGMFVKVVLTIAHLSEEIEDCSPENLRALCQACHNKLDAPMRARHRAENRERKRQEKEKTFNFDTNA